MMALMFLAAIIAYVFVSVMVIRGARRSARARGNSAARAGWIAAFVMYSIVFWDLIPSKIMMAYYCSQKTGLWVNVDPMGWQKRNPLEKSLALPNGAYNIDRSNNGFRDIVTANLRAVNRRDELWFGIKRIEHELVDIRSNETLAIERYFEAGACHGPMTLWDYRLWMKSCECAKVHRNSVGSFSAIITLFENRK